MGDGVGTGAGVGVGRRCMPGRLLLRRRSSFLGHLFLLLSCKHKNNGTSTEGIDRARRC